MNWNRLENALRKRALRLIRSVTRPDTVEIKGKNLKIDYKWSKQMIRVFHDQTYERDESELISKILEPEDKVLDIGSAVGFIGLLADDLASQVVMVEANEELVKIAKQNFKLNNNTPRIIHGAAVADTNKETVSFNLHENFWSGSLVDISIASSTVEVPAIPLSKLIQDHKPNVLTMDVEGAEYELLTKSDLTGINKICVEVHPFWISNEKIDEIVRHLILNGFTMVMNLSTSDNYFFKR